MDDDGIETDFDDDEDAITRVLDRADLDSVPDVKSVVARIRRDPSSE